MIRISNRLNAILMLGLAALSAARYLFHWQLAPCLFAIGLAGALRFGAMDLGRRNRLLRKPRQVSGHHDEHYFRERGYGEMR